MLKSLNTKDYVFIPRVIVQTVILIILLFQVSTIIEQLIVSVVLFLLWMGNVWLYKGDRFNPLFVRWFIALELIVLVTLFPLVPFAPYYILFIVTLVTAVINVEKLTEQIIISVTIVVFPIVHSFNFDDVNIQRIISFLLLIVFFVTFASIFKKQIKQQEMLQLLNEEIEAYAEQEQELAIEQERVRIARDIHDTVAHQSTGLIIQLQKLQYAYDQKDEHSVQESLEESMRVSRSMLDGMRQSVRAISPTEENVPLSNFQRLIDDFQNQTSTAIQTESLDQLEGLPIMTRTVLYRVMQEALTNAKQHGHATRITIDVSCSNNDLTLIISDNGEGLPKHFQEGFGLTHMTSRLEEINGSIFVNNYQNGCQLTIRVPVIEEGDL